MKTAFCRIMLVLTLVFTAGCASHRSVVLNAQDESEASETRSDLRRYFENRASDLLNIAKVGIGINAMVFTAEVDVEATILAHFGIGYSASVLFGLYDDELVWLEEVQGFPVTNIRNWIDHGWRGALVFHEHCPNVSIIPIGPPDPEHRCCFIPLLFTLNDSDEVSRFGPPMDNNALPPVRWADVEAGVAAFPIAARVGFSAGEMVDFLAGWFGLDPAGDDD